MKIAVVSDVLIYNNFSLYLNHFRQQQGSSPYLIEVGGSSYTGMFGYLTAFQEMMNQVNIKLLSYQPFHSQDQNVSFHTLKKIYFSAENLALFTTI